MTMFRQKSGGEETPEKKAACFRVETWKQAAFLVYTKRICSDINDIKFLHFFKNFLSIIAESYHDFTIST